MKQPLAICRYLQIYRAWRSLGNGYSQICQTHQLRRVSQHWQQRAMCRPILSRTAMPVDIKAPLGLRVDVHSEHNRRKGRLQLHVYKSHRPKPHRLIEFELRTPHFSVPTILFSRMTKPKAMPNPSSGIGQLINFMSTCSRYQSAFMMSGSGNNVKSLFSIDIRKSFAELLENQIEHRITMFSSVRLWHTNIVLAPEQISDLLQQNAVSVNFDTAKESEQRQSAVKKYDSNQLASNKPGEDRRAAAECIFTDGMMFGVFDGHRGPACAQAVSERLFNYIAAEILPYGVLPKVLKELKHGELHELVRWHRHPNDYILQSSSKVYVKSLIRYVEANLSVDVLDDDSMTDILTTAFDRLDKDFSMEAMQASDDSGVDAIHTVYSGSCACIAFVEDKDLYVANVGDCRAVLGRISNGQLEAVPLTVDQNADNVDEVNRIKSVHPPGESTTVIKNGRLLAELMPLRAFGDVRYKWTAEMQRQILRAYVGDILPKNYHTPPYLIATPEVMHHRITDGDKFLILATDGLWDMLTCEKAVSLVGEHIESMKASGPYRPPEGALLRDIQRDLQQRRAILKSLDTNSATHLTRYALCGVANEFDLDRLAEVVSYPASVARQHRDDITVTVIYFNS